MHQERLPNGVTLVVDDTSSVGSLALGGFMAVGSRHEAEENTWGMAHFLEHAAFKGADALDATAIATAMDNLGGEVNAYTTRDFTAFYAKVLEERGNDAAGLLGALMFHPTLTSDDIVRERQVIRQERLEADDDIEDRCEQLYMETLWEDAALSHDVLGTLASIDGIGEKPLRDFWRQHYRAPNVTLVVTGKEARAVADAWCQAAESWPPGEPAAPLAAPYASRQEERTERVRAEQIHVMLGTPGPRVLADSDAAYYGALILTTVLGGQNSSRLWMRLREADGLVYSVGATLESHPHWADAAIFLAVEPKNLERALRAIGEELQGVIRAGVRSEEVERARNLILTNLIFGSESPEGRMHRIGSWAMAGVLPPTWEQVRRSLSSITPDDVRDIASNLWGDPARLAIAAVGALPAKGPSLRQILADGMA